MYSGWSVHRHQIPLTTYTGEIGCSEQVFSFQNSFPQPVDKAGDSHTDVTCDLPGNCHVTRNESLNGRDEVHVFHTVPGRDRVLFWGHRHPNFHPTQTASVAHVDFT